MSRGFPGGGGANKWKLWSRKSRWSFCIKDNRKCRTFQSFHLKDDNGKLWVEMIIVTLLLRENKNSVSLVETRNVHFARLFKRRLVLIEWSNSTTITRIGQCYPWNTTWHCFYSIDPKASAKMAGIVNKVYCRFHSLCNIKRYWTYENKLCSGYSI